MLRWYVAVVPTLAAVIIGVAAIHTDWRVPDLARFLLLMCCGMISVAATPRIMYRTGGVTMDFTTVWVLPTAILLPPVYAAIIPFPMFAVMQFWVHRGILHRTVFTAASVSVVYAAVSVVFRLLPSSFAGLTVGSSLHAFTWVLVVVACYTIGGRLQYLLVIGAVKLSDPRTRISLLQLNRDALQGRLVEIDLGGLITLAVGISPALVVVVLPTVLLVRRFLVHPILIAQSRVDSKTGLLNVSTWEQEAEAELSRAVRTDTAMSLALVDIDHFKAVNDTYGHLVGDRVLKALADALTGQLRDYDRAGRFGGEEFVLLLAQATEDEAFRIAERLRKHVAEMAVPVSDAPGASCVRLTISIGVAAMAAGHGRDLTDMLAAADSALYRAKQEGRNRVSVATHDLDAELQNGFGRPVVKTATVNGSTVGPVAEPVKADPAGASLGPAALLSVLLKIREGSATVCRALPLRICTPRPRPAPLGEGGGCDGHPRRARWMWRRSPSLRGWERQSSPSRGPVPGRLFPLPTAFCRRR